MTTTSAVDVLTEGSVAPDTPGMSQIAVETDSVILHATASVQGDAVTSMGDNPGMLSSLWHTWQILLSVVPSLDY